MWRSVLDRPAHTLAALLVGASVLSLSLLALLTWHDIRRVRAIHERVGHTTRIERLALRVEQSLLTHPAESEPVDPLLIRNLRGEVEELEGERRALDPRTEARLARLHDLLATDRPVTRPTLVAAVAQVNQIVDAETRAQQALWTAIDDDARNERLLVLAALVVLFAAGALALVVFRRRILRPLADLDGLLSRLAERQFEPVHVDGVEPVLRPLFDNYNRLVARLEELEAAHREHARGLEQGIRTATEALLEQHSSLARAERLAAVGETTASLAHELRNPLAGILMSLGNLRHEATDPDVAERLDLVIAELERLTRMLNDALAAARHTPEPERRLDLARLVDDLLALLRYRVPRQVSLANAVPKSFECTLPRDRIRQALLNLVMNSVTALGGRSGRVEVAADRRNGRLEIRVSDDGPGFPEEMVASGVRAFASSSPGGTGLGLAMVRRVAVDLGGQLEVANSESGGALVRLVVPCGDG